MDGCKFALIIAFIMCLFLLVFGFVVLFTMPRDILTRVIVFALCEFTGLAFSGITYEMLQEY